jgi:catechol-2,3-dioxygenase
LTTPNRRHGEVLANSAPAPKGINTFQLPDETHVSRVQLRTANLKRLVTFYQDVIDFRVIDRGEAEALLSATGSAPAILV